MKLQKKLISAIAATALCSTMSLNAYEMTESTGIDQITEIIAEDEILSSKLSTEEFADVQRSTEGMNALIKEAIYERGLANDGILTTADAREVNDYLVENYSLEMRNFIGSNVGSESTGFYLANSKNTKSSTMFLGTNASKVWGQIYNLGYPKHTRDKVATHSGRDYATFDTVGNYLNEVMKADIESGELHNYDFTEFTATTGTNLDIIVETIFNDKGLLANITKEDMRIGSKAADAMNHLLIEAIKINGLANDGRLTTADIRTINNYLVANHEAEWMELHGDDEKAKDMQSGVKYETGYHRVQNDGATSTMFGDNIMNSIADGIYHLGFKTDRKFYLVNEDGNRNKRFDKVAWWLDTTLKSDILAGKFSNPDYEEVTGTTGTSLDQNVQFILSNNGYLRKLSMEEIREGARVVNEMNILIVEAIKETDVALDNTISKNDAKTLNTYLVANYGTQWKELNTNSINSSVEGIYNLGFKAKNRNQLKNKNGKRNKTFSSAGKWLTKSLQRDFESGVLSN